MLLFFFVVSDSNDTVTKRYCFGLKGETMENNDFNVWLAGFWEGEGCLSKHILDKGYSIQISQSLNNNRTVELCMKEIQKRFKGHLYKHNPQYKRHKSAILWKVSRREDVIFFLETIYPYCLIRKRDIENALKYCKTCNPPKNIDLEKIKDLRIIGTSYRKIGKIFNTTAMRIWRIHNNKNKLSYY